jgi:tetratricopeptide (TPR) repeat protein
LPEPVKPAPELLGEVLIEAGRASEAIDPFEQALRRTRNRSLSVLGLARARAAAGDLEKARDQYRALLANYDNADTTVAEVDEARRAIASATTARAPAATPPTNATGLAEKPDDSVGTRDRSATGASKDAGAAPKPRQTTRIPMMTAAAGAIIASLVMFAVRARSRSRTSAAGAAARSKQQRRTKKRPAR